MTRALASSGPTRLSTGQVIRRMEKLWSPWGIACLSRSQLTAMARIFDAQVADFWRRPLDAGSYTFVAADALVLRSVRAAGW